MSETEHLVQDFLLESAENLDQVDRDFVALERDPQNREILARLFRAIHTIKGSCGFLGFVRLQALAHAGESLLGLLREGELALDQAMATTLLRFVDAVRRVLSTIEETGGEGAGDHAELVAALDRHRAGAASGPASGAAVPLPSGAMPEATAAFVAAGPDLLLRIDRAFAALAEEPRDAVALEALSSALGGARGSCKRARLDGLDGVLERADALLEVLRAGRLALEPAVFEVLLDAASSLGEALATVERGDGGPEPDYRALLARLQGAVADAGAGVLSPPRRPGAVEEAPRKGDRAPPGLETPQERAIRRASVVDQTIRVDVDLLDRLMNQVGELVLARNQLQRHVALRAGEALDAMAQRVSQITSELQVTVMRTRLQPIETVWNRLPRLVRDLALELGKRVTLVLEGGETELDRTLNEAIRGPLTHLVRNALDHGLETEVERIRAGKSPEGTLTLRAWHEGGQVNVEIADDGRGIDLARVVRTAQECGMVAAEEAGALSDREKAELIFRPGFSTAAVVTSVSGRGVGMDVVKSSVERINGLVEIATELGRGTRIRLKIPLTVAIIPALIVRCAGERYAIPQLSLVAVLRLTEEEARTKIERLHHAPVHRWRGRLLPLVSLRRELRLPEVDAPYGISIVVLQVEGPRFGLVVDQVLDTEEIVVKPLGQVIGRIPVFAGATIMGDGRPAVILDVLGLAGAAAVGARRPEGRAPAAVEPAEGAGGARQAVLLVRIGEERAAIPLTGSLRLERFPRAAVETSGGRPIVQYRGCVLPLVPLGGEAGLVPDQPTVHVVVHGVGDEAVGFVVDELLDVVHERVVVRGGPARGDGVVGTAVIHDRVAQVFDLGARAR